MSLVIVLTGCGGGCSYVLRPAPMEDPVDSSAIVGTWRYHTLAGKEAHVSFASNGTFDQVVPLEPEPLRFKGTWRLEGSDLLLDGFYDSAWPDSDRKARFYVTDWYIRDAAPFGGEADADHWEIWRRVEGSS